MEGLLWRMLNSSHRPPPLDNTYTILKRDIFQVCIRLGDYRKPPKIHSQIGRIRGLNSVPLPMRIPRVTTEPPRSFDLN